MSEVDKINSNYNYSYPHIKKAIKEGGGGKLYSHHITYEDETNLWNIDVVVNTAKSTPYTFEEFEQLCLKRPLIFGKAWDGDVGTGTMVFYIIGINLSNPTYATLVGINPRDGSQTEGIELPSMTITDVVTEL